MIQIKSLTKIYGKNTVVNDSNWVAKDGEITGFIGPNGAGKTTTLKMITGVIKPDKGNVLINGIDIAKQPLEAKRQFGYVSDSPDHFLRLKGIEYLSFIADVFDVSDENRNKFIKEVPQKLGMEEALSKPILSYSHGMRQKIMILGALIHNPSVWILDEPLTGLDPQAAYELKKMMREHASKGNSVLFSTHVLEVAEKLCDKVVIITKGNLKFNGTVKELKDEYKEENLESIFLKITGGKDE